MREIVCTGPTPPEGRQFCGLCLMVFKRACLAAVDKDLQDALRDPANPEPYVIHLAEVAREHGIAPPAVVAGVALNTMIQGAPLPCCWTHVQAVQFTALAAAVPGIPGDPALVPRIGGR